MELPHPHPRSSRSRAPAPRLPAALAALLILPAGCGAGNFFSSQTVPGNPDGEPYRAFGDSITYGETLSNRITQAYPSLIAGTYGLALHNYAVDNQEACDLAPQQIFPNSVFPSNSVQSLYTILIGATDANSAGAGPHEVVFNLCQQAAIAWLAVPAESKTLAPAATVSGATHIETAGNWNAVFTDAAGATATFSLQTPAAGPVYLWYRILDGNPGVFTYSLDRAAPVTATTATVPAVRTAIGTSSSLALIRIPAVPAGSHTVLFTQTSTAPSGMGIVAVGTPPLSAVATRPRVLVGTIPLENIAGNIICVQSIPSQCTAYVNDIMTNVALLASDGLNVQLFDSRKYMSGTSADLNDYAHPNTVGQMEIAHALQDVY